VPLYSGEVEDFLVPIMFRMRRGDEVTVVAELRSPGGTSVRARK
jgi:hypothetical protein